MAGEQDITQATSQIKAESTLLGESLKYIVENFTRVTESATATNAAFKDFLETQHKLEIERKKENDLAKESAKIFGVLNLPAKELNNVLQGMGAKALSTVQAQTIYIDSLRKQKNAIESLKMTGDEYYKTVIKNISDMEKENPNLKKSFNDLWNDMKNGRLTVDTMSSNFSTLTGGLTSMATRATIGAWALNQVVDVFKNMTLGAMSTSLGMERARRTAGFGAVAPWSAQQANSQELLALGGALGKTPEASKELASTFASLNIATTDHISNIEEAMKLEALTGQDAKSFGTSMRYIQGTNLRDNKDLSSSFKVLYQGTSEAGGAFGLMKDQFDSLIASTRGMNINADAMAGWMTKFTDRISAGTIDFGNLSQGIRGMNLGQVAGFTQLARKYSPTYGGEFKGNVAEDVSTWYDMRIEKQAGALSEIFTNLSASASPLAKQQALMLRAQIANVPGFEQFKNLPTADLKGVLSDLAKYGKVSDKRADDLAKKYGGEQLGVAQLSHLANIDGNIAKVNENLALYLSMHGDSSKTFTYDRSQVGPAHTRDLRWPGSASNMGDITPPPVGIKTSEADITPPTARVDIYHHMENGDVIHQKVAEKHHDFILLHKGYKG